MSITVDKIAELKAKQAKELEFATLELSLIEKCANAGIEEKCRLIDSKRPFLVIGDALTNEIKLFKKVLELFPVTEQKEVKTASDTCGMFDFHMSINNSGRHCRFSAMHELKISWKSGEIDIWLAFDCSKDFFNELIVSGSSRKITDSEHHYYTGMSYKELGEIRLPVKTFKSGNKRLYGGTRYLICSDMVKSIADLLKGA